MRDSLQFPTRGELKLHILLALTASEENFQTSSYTDFLPTAF